MRVLVLRFPSFVVDVERAWLGLSADQPLVVGGPPDGPGVVAAACALARRDGVSVGQPLVEAAAVCPTARFVPGILDRYAEAASQLDEEVRRVCGAVAWRAIDEAVITDADVIDQGTPLAVVADTLRVRLRDRLALSVAAGVADGEVAASLAARMVAPSGLLQVLPGYDARVIAPLPVAWLSAMPATARQRLEDQGITTLGALASLDAGVATDLLGAKAPEWQRLSTGVAIAAAPATRVMRSLTRAQTTPHVVSLDDLRHAIAAVSVEVEERMVQLGLCARTLTVRVVGPDDRSRSRSATLPIGIAGRWAIGPAARTLAEQLWRYGSQTSRISVVASGLSSDGPQLTLFGAGHAGGDGQRAPAAWRPRRLFSTAVRRQPRAS